MKKVLAIMLSVVTVMTLFAGCSSKQTEVKPEDFRVTAYVTAESIQDLNNFTAGHISEVTDIIYIGASDFNEQGEVIIKDNFENGLNNLRTLIGERDVNLYCSITGPGSQSDSDDWYEQMADQAEHHKVAFESGVLENNILAFLKEYGFDGIFFDYEYCIKKKYWKDYNKFIVSLDSMLGDDYKIGMALSGWDLGQNKAAREATDFVELMCYDLWEDDGTHASVDLVKRDIKSAKKAGYDLSKIDIGLPFYARPTDHGGYWYDYRGYYDRLDDKGFFEDKDDTGLTFSFNTPAVISEKTKLAMDSGCGGVMIWHWACDTEYGNDSSLFKAINDARA